jgi:thiol-disulfide isomerase/thioredoxin
MRFPRLFFPALLVILHTAPALALQVNDAAPSFSLRDSNGGDFFFSDHIGSKKKTATRGMILSFFASYCEPCKRELPVMNRLVDEFEKKGIKIVIVGFNEDFNKFSGLLDELKVDKPVILSDLYGKTGQKYGVTHLPMTFFISADGKVNDMIRGELTNIESVLREKAGKLLK